LPSLTIVGIALICSVGAESMFIHFASRTAIRENFIYRSEHRRNALFEAPMGEEMELQEVSNPKEETVGEDQGLLTYRKLLHFHLPLTATTMVMLMGNPVVSAALARAPESVLAMASFQVAATLAWLCRTITFALPEVVITMYRDEQSAKVLRRFCMNVGFGTSAVAALLFVTRADVFFFQTILGANEPTAKMAHLAFLACVFLPVVNASQSYVRGMLTAHHLTGSRLWAVMVSISVLVALLAVGVSLRWTGVISAGAALTGSSLAELAVLAWFWRAGVSKSGHLQAA
jgi:hypothetical protein